MACGGNHIFDGLSTVNGDVVHHNNARSTRFQCVNCREESILEPIQEIIGVEVSFAYFSTIRKVSPDGVSRENCPGLSSVDGTVISGFLTNWCVSIMPPSCFFVEN